jgi:hypothetical protein
MNSETRVVGFDIRVHASEQLSVDALMWPQDEQRYAEALARGLSENELQLLVSNPEKIEDMVDSVAVGLAVAVREDVEALLLKRFNGPLLDTFISGSDLVRRNWRFRGFDVADVDGLFSAFGIGGRDALKDLGRELFQDYSEAQKTAHRASLNVPAHAPFVPFALYTFSRAP